MTKAVFFTLSFLLFLVACAPTATQTPISASTKAASSAVEMMDDFYTAINTAQTKGDLSKLWKLISLDEQCNPVYQCNLDRFQDKLWQAKGPYRIYDCGSNVIIVEEIHSPQSDSSSSTPAAPKFVRYKFLETEEGLLINDVSVTQAPGDGCVLAVESPK